MSVSDTENMSPKHQHRGQQPFQQWWARPGFFFLFWTERKHVCGNSVVAEKLCFCNDITGVFPCGASRCWDPEKKPGPQVLPESSASVLFQPRALLSPFGLCLGVTFGLRAHEPFSSFCSQRLQTIIVVMVDKQYPWHSLQNMPVFLLGMLGLLLL